MMSYLQQAATGSLLRQNIVYTLGRQMLAAAAQLLLVVFIARVLGPEGNGHYAMAVLLPSMLVSFLNLGVGVSTVYYLGRKEVTLKQVVRENTTMACIIAAVGTTGTLVVIKFWGQQLFPGIPTALLFLGVVAFPISLLLSYFNTIFQGLEDFRSFNLTVLLPPYVTLIGVLLVLYCFDLGVLAAVACYVFGELVGLFLVMFLLARYRKSEDKESISKQLDGYKSRVLSYGFRAHLSNILAFVNYRADIFLVNFFLSPAATGLYVLAVQFAERLWMLSQAASTVLLPRLVAMHADPRARYALTQKAFIFTATLTCIAVLVVGLVLHWLLVPVFGADYRDAFQPFLWLSPGIVAGAGSRIQANCIAAAGKPEWNMYVSLLVVVLNITGNILLIPIYGITGAAIATSVAYVVNAIVKSVLIRKV